MKPNLFRCILPFFALASALSAQTFQSGPATTALIELYTSEGCSSCPPAEHWLGELKTDKGLWTKFVPVAFHITYWDDLGWPDPYANPAFTQRQRGYAAAWNSSNVYTPEFIYQGREWRIGNVTPATGRPGLLIVHLNPDGSGTVKFTPDGPSSAKSYETSVALLGADMLVKVRAGENAGRTLSHDFVALHIVSLHLARSADGGFGTSFLAPPEKLPKAGRHALATWVSISGDLAPLQATGGWID